MSKTTTFKFSGGDELAKRFRQIKAEVTEKLVKRVCYDSAAIIRDEAQRRAPEDSGRLKLFIGRSVRKDHQGLNRVVIAVGLLKISRSLSKKHGVTSDAYYATYVEFGTRFQAAQPFLRPALESSAPRFLDDYIPKLKRNVDAAWDKQHKR